MDPEPLIRLLEPADEPPDRCVARCGEALAAAGVAGAPLLRLLGSTWREDLSPTWAALALADAAAAPPTPARGAVSGGRGGSRRDGASEDGASEDRAKENSTGENSGRRAARARALLGRLAAEVVAGHRRSLRDGNPTGTAPSCLAVALAQAQARGVSAAPPLEAAVAARRTELDVASFATRRELAEHLRRRGRALPTLILERAAATSERRALLIDAAVTAAELARGLLVQGRDLELGRLVLSAEDLARLGANPSQLRERPTPVPLRRAMSEQVVWARLELAKAWALTSDLGWRRAAIAGAWLRGIETQLRSVERADFDLNGRAIDVPVRLLELSWLHGALWWLPPRSVSAPG